MIVGFFSEKGVKVYMDIPLEMWDKPTVEVVSLVKQVGRSLIIFCLRNSVIPYYRHMKEIWKIGSIICKMK